MIINTGMRTDIPAYYSEWFLNRIRAGYVLVRNPYYPSQVTKYRLTPDVVDVLAFCTKNPAPMFPFLKELGTFRQFWFVTITPYGKEIEPNVPDKTVVLESFQKLSDCVGSKAVAWRYDPVFVTEKYSLAYHIETFQAMAETLRGYTSQVVISFIDLYQKTKKNFWEVRKVAQREETQLAKAFVRIGKQNDMTIKSCFERKELADCGVDISGCMTKEVLEQAIGEELDAPKKRNPRLECNCLLGNDIGMYNTCEHFCRYCYANYDSQTVIYNRKHHNPESPFLIGGFQEGDIVTEAKQVRYVTGQMRLPF